MPDNPTLRILLLGTPGTYVDDQPLQIQRRLLRWMLAYLACQSDLVGRSDLILHFWPDEPEEDARRHLRETLSKLRAQLPDPNLIITGQDRVGLDPQRTYSDVREFQSLFSQTARICAQTPASSPLTQAVHEKVVQAVRLWRAPRFMAGARLPDSENLNNWLLSFSQQMETQRQRLLERLVDHDSASGDIESAIQWLRLALEGDETNESLHYRLLSLFHRQGRYSEALNYCSYLQELFRREGFEELPPSLLSLSRKIREEASHPESDSERPAWPSLAEMQVPFTGRQALLQELQFAIRRGNPVILFGEAGSGKSRLVRELFFSLKPAPRLLLAPARMMESSLPFQPIVDMLRHDIQAEEWRQMDRVWVTPLSLLLPELLIMRPEIHSPQIAPDQEPGLIYEALRQLFLFLKKKQRFLLFLDNAQWSDKETLAALAYLAERGLFGENSGLVLAARLEQSTPHLLNFLNRPHSSFSIQRLVMPPLNTEEIAVLSRYILGDAYTPELNHRLERETGGNPLFLLETLRLLLDYAIDRPLSQSIDHLPLAGTVHALIRERLQFIPPYDFQVLSIAAVLGNEFSMDLLESTSQLPPEQVAQSLESLAQLNLIKATLSDLPSARYAFVHDKFREVILLEMSPARKRLLHLRIAHALEQKYQGQSPELEAELANHYEEAGELNTAFHHWLSAALYAGRLFAKDTAFYAYRRAEEVLQRLGQRASDLSVYQLYRQWGRLAYDFSDPDMVEKVYSGLLVYGENRQNPLLAGSAYNGLAQAAELRLLPKQGLAYLEKAAPYIDQSGRMFEHIEALNRQGVFYVQLEQFEEAQRAFEKALSRGERANDSQGIEARSQTEYWLAQLLTLTGWPVPALEMARQSIRDATEVFNQAAAAHARSVMALIQCQLGRYQEALEQATTGLETALAMGSPPLLGDLHGTMASACLAHGDLDRAWQHIQQGIESLAVEGSPFSTARLYHLLGQLYIVLGDPEKAGHAYRLGCQSTSQVIDTLPNQIGLATITAALGDPALALEQLADALTRAQQNGMVVFQLTTRLSRASVLLDLGKVDEAQPDLKLVSAEASRRAFIDIQNRCTLLNGKAALRQGEVDQALALYLQAAAQARESGNLPLEIEGYALWLEAACPGRETGVGEARARLEECIHILESHTRLPGIQELLQKQIRAWTNSP